MSPPPDHSSAFMPQAKLATEDLQRVKWAGWRILGSVVVIWVGWISLTAIANSTRLTKTEVTHSLQYEQLRKDIAEVKELVKP